MRSRNVFVSQANQQSETKLNKGKTMDKVTKKDLEDMIMDLLMAQGYLEAKGKGFKQKGLDRLADLYLQLSKLKDSL